MTIKSPLSIVEDALAAKLAAEATLSPYHITNGAAKASPDWLAHFEI